MRKKDEALRGILLEQARKIVEEEGPQALNMRTLAKRAGVASGTVYNYFSGKDEIMLALTEAYWQKALAGMYGEIHAASFTGRLREIYGYLKRKIADSGGMLMGSLANVQAAGQKRMQDMQAVLRGAIVEQMREDEAIKPGVWNKALTEEMFAEFILLHMMLLLRTEAADIDPFLEVVRRVLY